jgi:hypothetical protein
MLPEPAVPLHPDGGLAHRSCDEVRDADTSLPANGGEPRSLEHADMLGDRGQRHREAAGQLADRPLPAGEAGQDLAPRTIGEGGEGAVELRLTVNHMVYYGAWGAGRQGRAAATAIGASPPRRHITGEHGTRPA